MIYLYDSGNLGCDVYFIQIHISSTETTMILAIGNMQSHSQVALVRTAGVPRQQPHRRSGLATLPSVGAVP